ncbi:hypothetical protein ACFVFI_11045 [Streptomyces sp. NPDC057705]|uniref:hypothetical protein n=1 Tax=Streptomyces sp. NPDC057705 TaxID=3346222 RepID=UPI0036BA3602
MAKWRLLARRVLFGAGLALTAIELAMFGVADAGGALTLSGRISGVIFLVAALTEIAAIIAFRDQLGPRPARYSSLLILTGVLISLTMNLTLLALQLDSRSYTHLIWVWLALFPWSCWALWQIHRSGVWGTLPSTKGLAVGAVATSLLAVANFTYTQIYQPYSSPALVTTTAEFGKAIILKEGGATAVSLRLRTKNAGKVGVYILGSLYHVAGRKASFSNRHRTLQDWEKDPGRRRELSLYTRRGTDDVVAQGAFIGEGGTLEPGAEIVAERVIQFPADSRYDVIGVAGEVVFLRKDRGTIASVREISAGDSTRPFRADPLVVGRSARIYESTAVLEFTRAPQHVSVWWVTRGEAAKSAWSYLMTSIEREGGRVNFDFQLPSETQVRRVEDRYGLGWSFTGYADKSLKELMGQQGS